jgi:hypothetical protein
MGAQPQHRLRQGDTGRSMTRRDYLLAELRCASLRAWLWQAEIGARWLTPEQAVEAHCLQLVEPKEIQS